MKTKNLLPLLFVLIATFNSMAQTHVKLNIEPTINADIIEVRFNNQIPLKSAEGGNLVLDSMKRTEYMTARDTSQVYTYTYKYNSEGREIEYMMRSSCMYCPGRRDDFKQVLEYDEKGNPKKSQEYLYDYDTENWVLNVQSEIECYENGQTKTILQKQLNINTNELVNYRKIENTYSNYSEFPTQVVFVWNENSSQWELSTKREEIYDDNGNVIRYGYYNYDLENEEWMVQLLSEYYYDHNGYDSIRFQTYAFDNSMDYQMEEYKVDAEGRIIETLVSDKDTAGNWEAWLKEIYEFDQNGNNTYTEQIVWQPSYNMWITSSKTEIEFDLILNKEILSLHSRWDINTSTWIQSYRYDYEYDSNGNQIYYLSANWNQSKNEWENTRQYIYEYDEYDNQVFYGSYEWRNNSWWLSYKYEYFYSELSTGLNDYLLQTSGFRIYPNPASENLTIEIKNREMNYARIYNSIGESVKALPLQQGINTVNISDLNNGLYFLQMPSNKGMVGYKIVKN